MTEMTCPKDGCNVRPLSCLYVSAFIPPAAKDILCRYTDRLVLLPAADFLAPPVNSHADLLVFYGKGRLFVAGEYFYKHSDLFGCCEVPVIPTALTPGKLYPDDVLLDGLPLGDTLYCRPDSTAAELLAEYKQVKVRQGYARCSCVKLGEDAVITEDRGIAEAVASHGGESLLVSGGQVHLEGYGCGFIGGASVYLCDEAVGFFGDITLHPDYTRMCSFAQRRGIRLVPLCDGKLVDCGGGVSIDKRKCVW